MKKLEYVFNEKITKEEKEKYLKEIKKDIEKVIDLYYDRIIEKVFVIDEEGKKEIKTLGSISDVIAFEKFKKKILFEIRKHLRQALDKFPALNYVLDEKEQKIYSLIYDAEYETRNLLFEISKKSETD